MQKRYLYGLTLACLLIQAITATQAVAAPKPKLWEKWTAHNPNDARSIDHTRWGRFLNKHVQSHVSGVNRIAYGQVSDSSRASLQTYINGLAQIPISEFNRQEQLAYWVNLYNALTVKVVLGRYPVRSIRDIKSGLFSSGPWGKKLVTVEAEQLTLDDIEHRILRPIWKDPRIHYAVNCAAIGCPNLQPIAFTAAAISTLLDQAAAEYINHPRGVTVNGRMLVVSSIYIWFQTDFGDSDEGVIQHLRQYASADLSKALATVMKISDDGYDWTLNDIAAP
ncbi:MAG: DUF547 domain-containing protein [Gammaproteobacteria bacterium]|nr:DUF547 domain-containing protein [Gammaproteobacteria bacterium]